MELVIWASIWCSYLVGDSRLSRQTSAQDPILSYSVAPFSPPPPQPRHCCMPFLFFFSKFYYLRYSALYVFSCWLQYLLVHISSIICANSTHRPKSWEITIFHVFQVWHLYLVSWSPACVSKIKTWQSLGHLHWNIYSTTPPPFAVSKHLLFQRPFCKSSLYYFTALSVSNHSTTSPPFL